MNPALPALSGSRRPLHEVQADLWSKALQHDITLRLAYANPKFACELCGAFAERLLKNGVLPDFADTIH
jgi:hypothetical protein